LIFAQNVACYIIRIAIQADASHWRPCSDSSHVTAPYKLSFYYYYY